MQRAFADSDAATAGVGHVTLAGAGPGDPELLTLKVLRLIREADAIVHDALISPEILALFPPGAEVYDVGKRAGAACSPAQEEIHALLVALARRGLRVLRLKGGDPLVFGRGGEEAMHLHAHGIPWELVPGVSAAQGAAAAAGIPLTHRGLARTCTVLEGHGPHLDSIDWAALVALGGTWVFYMATQSAAEIAARLIAHGADPQLPLALVAAATLEAQRVSVLPLHAVARGALPPCRPHPGLLLVGPSIDLLNAAAAALTPGAPDVTVLPDLSAAAR